MSLLRNVYTRHGRPIQMCRPMRASPPDWFSNESYSIQYNEVPAVELHMPHSDWDQIERIVRLFERQQEHPGLKDLAEQYFMYEALLGEKK